MASADKTAANADRPMDAPEASEKGDEAQEVSSAAAEEVESEWSLLTLPSALEGASRLPVAEEGPTFSQEDDLVPELPPYFDKDFSASRMFQEPDRSDEPPNLGSFPEEMKSLQRALALRSSRWTAPTAMTMRRSSTSRRRTT